MTRLLLACVVVAACGCTDRTREVPAVFFEQFPDDMSPDMPDDGPPPTPDIYCEAAFDGSSCALPGARGVCVRQQCVLVACESGFGDCTARLGCETSLAEAEHCGACDSACGEAQGCVPGPTGYACAAGIVCPTDTYDLDSDPSNGCEWRATWEASLVLAPPDMQIETAGWGDGALLVAGGADDIRVSVALVGAPQTTVWPQARGSAVAIEVIRDDDFERVVWTDGISLRRLADQATFFLQPVCDAAAVERRFVGAAGPWVATQFEVLRVDTECAEGACLVPVLGLADYQAASYDGFSPSELATCDGCALALDAECWGPEQCQVNFDVSACTGCDPTGCPRLQIVDLVAQPQSRLAIVTNRGVLLLDSSGALVERVESPYEPAVAGGPRFVKGLAAPGALTLAHSTGFLRVLDAELFPQFPDLGVAFDPEAAALAGAADVVFAVSEDAVRIVQPAALSGRTVFVDLTTAPGIQGLRAVALADTPDGVRAVYAAAGLVYTRLFSPR